MIFPLHCPALTDSASLLMERYINVICRKLIAVKAVGAVHDQVGAGHGVDCAALRRGPVVGAVHVASAGPSTTCCASAIWQLRGRGTTTSGSTFLLRREGWFVNHKRASTGSTERMCERRAEQGRGGASRGQ